MDDPMRTHEDRLVLPRAPHALIAGETRLDNPSGGSLRES